MGIPGDKIEWIETLSKVREEYLEQGKVDLVAAPYTINDERKKVVDFAGPYYVAGQQLMTRRADSSITGPESLRAGAKKVCSVTGSTPAQNITKYLKNKTTQPMPPTPTGPSIASDRSGTGQDAPSPRPSAATLNGVIDLTQTAMHTSGALGADHRQSWSC